MPVYLRKRKNSDGSTSLFLAIPEKNELGKWGYKYQFLKECKLEKASNPIQREENRRRKELAEKIRSKVAEKRQSEDYDITPSFRQDIDFLAYFQAYLDKYKKKDSRLLVACFNKFKQFLKESEINSLNAKQLDEDLVKDFKEFLEDKMNGETPANYFKKFKKVLKQALRAKIITSNPAAELTAKRNEGVKKDILNFEEIQLLASTPANNEEVKKAFLFSCLTGLRFCDISTLKWESINGQVMKIKQQKTSKDVTIILNDSALNLLGKPQKSAAIVFNLPTHTACLKGLKSWCKAAGIQKHITWHCARHSFATNIIFYGSDVNSASSLLGHSSLAYTQRYLRIANELKEKAVHNLPSISIN
jgi:integrase/recombinase XerD